MYILASGHSLHEMYVSSYLMWILFLYSFSACCWLFNQEYDVDLDVNFLKTVILYQSC